MKRFSKVLVMLGLLWLLLLHNLIEVQAEEYEYDSLNRVTRVTYEDGSYVEYEYDKNGNIVEVNIYEMKNDEGNNGGEDNDEGSNEEGQIPPVEENGTTGDGDEEDNEQPSTGESDKPEKEEGLQEKDIVTKILDEVKEYVTDFIRDVVGWFKSLFKK